MTSTIITGFLLCKSDIFTIKSNRAFLCKVSKVKDCFCQQHNILIQSDSLKHSIDNSIEDLFSEIQIRNWYTFHNIKCFNLSKSIDAESSPIYKWETDSFISSTSLTIYENSKKCESCNLPSHQLVNFEGVIANVDDISSGIIWLKNNIALYFLGKIGPELDALVNHTLYCYNVWLINDCDFIPSNVSPFRPGEILIADIVSFFTMDIDKTVVLSNIGATSCDLYKLVHNHSLTPMEIINYCNLHCKLRNVFNKSADNFSFLKKLIQQFHCDRIPRQFTTSFINFNYFRFRDCKTRIIHSLTVDDICDANDLQRESSLNDKMNLTELSDTYWLCGKLSFNHKLSHFVLKDSFNNSIPSKIEGDWSCLARKEGAVVIKHCRIVCEQLESKTLKYILFDVKDVLPKISLNETMAVLSQPQSSQNVTILSKSGLQLSPNNEPYFLSNCILSDSACKIRFSSEAAFLYPRIIEGSIYSVSGINDNLNKPKEIISVRDFDCVHFIKSVDQNVSVMSVSEILESTPPKFCSFSLWGIVKSKIILSSYSWKIVLEDSFTFERIELFSCHPVNMLYGIFLNEKVLITNCENQGYYSLTENSDLRLINRAPAIVIPSIKFLFDVVANRSSCRFLSNSMIKQVCRLSLYLKDNELSGSCVSIIDDGTLEALLFMNKLPHLRKLLNLTSNQMEYLTSSIKTRRSDYHYYCKQWDNSNSSIIECRSIDQYLAEWLRSSLVLRPVSFLLRQESPTQMNFHLKSITFDKEELTVLKSKLPNLLCLHIDDLSC